MTMPLTVFVLVFVLAPIALVIVLIVIALRLGNIVNRLDSLDDSLQQGDRKIDAFREVYEDQSLNTMPRVIGDQRSVGDESKAETWLDDSLPN